MQGDHNTAVSRESGFSNNHKINKTKNVKSAVECTNRSTKQKLRIGSEVKTNLKTTEMCLKLKVS